MGACCSCQLGGRFEGYLFDEEREVEDEDIVLRGDNGALIRLQGSSKYVSMCTQQGKKGVNQDAMAVWESFSGDKDMFYCSVFDGHGPSGHKVARYIRDFLPAKISLSYKQTSTDGVLELDNSNSENPDFMNPFFLSWKARLAKCFEDIDQQLEGNASIESYCSGSTSVSVLKKGQHLIISNLGDSRAVLCKRDINDRLVSQQLTVDLKPNLPDEAQRIRSCKGRVLSMDEEPSVYRVWMPDEDCPGLAMSRAFGDFCLKDYGLIATPEVTYRKLTERDEFIVLATDGIWDVLSNDEVVSIVASSRKRSMASKLLIEKAVRAWRYKFPSARIDDCTVICLFFKKQRPLLTKSISEITHLSLNYSEIEGNGYARSDDGLDTVLNCNVDDGVENGSDESSFMANRAKKRRGRKLEPVVE